MELTKVITKGGTVFWKQETGREDYHREDAPAVICDGIALWIKNGNLLRQDAPYWRVGMDLWKEGRPLAGQWVRYIVETSPGFSFAHSFLRENEYSTSRLRVMFERMRKGDPYNPGGEALRVLEDAAREIDHRGEA